MEETITYCINHPQTPTVLRCNKCNRPVCMKCVERTAVGYRCRECLGLQRQGYYNATPADYAVAIVVGVFLSIIAGVIMAFIGRALGGFGGILIAVFAGPAGGALVAEGIRTAVQRHRGRYLWLVACAAIILGGLAGIFGLPLFSVLGSGRLALLVPLTAALVFNFGFWIYVALAVTTAYSRLRI